MEKQHVALSFRGNADDSFVAGAEATDLPLEEWWLETAKRDIGITAPKALSYGATGLDLIAIGKEMADIGEMEVPRGVDSDQFYTELGIHFYLRGKIARAAEAFRTGRLPSDDTLFDISIYSVMWRRARQHGVWG